MPPIIQALPFFDHPTSISAQGQPVRIFPWQIVLWVSVAPKGLLDLGPGALRLPAVLDIGFNHNFLIQEQHLTQWAGLDPKSLRRLGSLPVHGQKVPLLNANIWLHSNRPGSRDEFADAAAWQWEMDAGIAVCPSELGNFPRLPLIGLRAVQLAGLHVAIDGSKSQVSIGTRMRLLIFD